MLTRIVVVSGPDKGRSFPLTDETTLVIGRGSTSHTRLLDPAVSRSHCELHLEGNRVVVTDGKSATGTQVNGQRIARHELRDGDVIHVGDTELRFDQQASEQATTFEPAPAGQMVFANKPGARYLPKPLKDLHDLVGKSIGSYRLLEVAGTGQIGVVFRARDGKDQKTVALKVLRPDFLTDKKAVQRFVRGIQAARTLSHPNLVELYNAGITEPYCWIAMEFIEGESLAERIQRLAGSQAHDWKQALQLAIDVSRSLDFIHGRGIMHRNVMPQNIMIRKSDQLAKLGDVMLAKALEGSGQPVTESGEYVGNVYYMAPERTVRGAGVDGRADIYSLGVTVFLLLTGRLPFEGTSLPEVVEKIRKAEPDRPGKFCCSIPNHFEGIVLRMLAKKPEERFQTAQELVAELEGLMGK